MGRDKKTKILSVLLAVNVMATPMLAASPWAGLDEYELTRTCNYFENRARFVPRGPDMPLDAILADSCNAALYRFTDRIGTTPYEAKRARIYLERLTTYKTQIISMNRAGFAKARREKPVQMGGAPRVEVSATGEYLIARAMGVLSSYGSWARVAHFRTAAD